MFDDHADNAILRSRDQGLARPHSVNLGSCSGTVLDLHDTR